MKIKNYAWAKLNSYLRTIENRQFSTKDRIAASEKLLSLSFAYIRNIKGIHLRWQHQEAINLACLTTQELQNRKNTDPVLNRIHNALLKINGNIPEAVDELLRAAEARLDEISKSQSAKASTKRVPNPIIRRALEIKRQLPGLNQNEIISKLRSEISNGAHEKYDDETFSYIDPKDPRRQKTITVRSVKNALSKKSNNISRQM